MILFQCRLHDESKPRYVVADSGEQALTFLGVRDGSASAHPVSYHVEVAGLHPAHPPIPPLPIASVPREFGVLRFTPSSGRNNDFDTRSAAGFNAADCADGTCKCAPTCGLCGKGAMYDNKRLPGWHDWTCPHCLATGYQLWKEAEAVDV